MSNTTSPNKSMSIERHEELEKQLKSIFEEFSQGDIQCVIAYERPSKRGSDLHCNGKKSFLHCIVAGIFKGIIEPKL